MINAEVHSDDYAVEAKFDATPWFEQASDDDIRNLAKIDWDGGEAADRVAYFFKKRAVEVGELFEYLSHHPTMGNGDTVGFECHVNPDDAARWLRDHRNALYLEMLQAEQIEEPIQQIGRGSDISLG